MNFTVKGKITKILEEQKGTSKAGKDWIKGGFVINTGDQYNNIYCFDIFGDDKLNQFDANVGDTLDVFFNINTNEYQGKYFTSLQYWRSDNLGQNVSKVVSPIDTNESEPDDFAF